MLGAVILVLVIACVNVMNMQFGRGRVRAKNWPFAARSARPVGDSLGK